MSRTPATILFLHPSAELYGADRTLLQVVEGLDRARWRAVVALPRRGPLADALERAGARVEVGELGIGARGDLTPRRLLALAWRVPRGALFALRLVRRHRPALVHTNTLVVLGGAIGARLARVPHLWHVHEILERPRWLARLQARLLGWLADEVVYNSGATRASFVRWNPALAQRGTVVLNGVEPARVDAAGADPARVRSELGLQADAPLVLLVGRYNSWKGQTLLVEAAARLRRRHPRARFALVGDAPPGQLHFERELHSAIEHAAVGDIVQCASFREDVASLFAAADICVVPSTRPEPFGLVAAEAMALGRPVVAADHGGLAEVVVDGETGLLVAPGDAAALAAAIDELLGDPQRAARMGRAGRARQREHFTARRYVGQLEARFAALTPQRVRAALPAETRVVHIVLGKANPDRANGVNRVVHQLATEQVRTGRPVEVWGLTPTPEAPTSPRPYRLRCFARGPWRVFLDRGLRHAIDSAEGPVLFHLHGGLLPEMARCARRIARAGHAYVFTPHGAYASEALRRRARSKRLVIALFDRALMATARAVHALTEREAIDVARLAGAARTVIVPSGQDQLQVPPADLGLPRPVFVFLGRLLAHTKGLDVLLEAFARYAQERPGSLLLVGDGPDRAALEARARDLGLAERVVFLGARYGTEKLAIVSACDAFVHPSRHEGLPGAVLEAAALGLTLLVTEGTNLSAEVRRAGAGLALGAVEVEPLTEALRELADADHDTRVGWSYGARELIASNFSWDQVQRTLAEELYAIAARAPSPAAARTESGRTGAPGRPLEEVGP